MKLIFIYGLPATGKLTVARELASLTGYKLFHNHLVVDTLLSVFAFGTKPFVELREAIWLSVFREACAAGLNGLIFTFAPERTVTPQFIPAVCSLLQRWGGEVGFVELVCPSAEIKARMLNDSRLQSGKLSSVKTFEQLLADGAFDTPQMPRPDITLDTSLILPVEAAHRIVRALKLLHPTSNADAV